MQGFKAEQARAIAALRWKALPKPDGREEWIQRAREASSNLKIDAVERDSASKAPFPEVQLLKDAELVNLLGPRKYGGAGEAWQTSYTDASIGHLLGNHFRGMSKFWSSQILGTPKQTERWLREFTEGNYCLGGAVNPRNAAIVAEDAGLDLVFNGDKFFSRGGVISDITVLESVLQHGTHVFAYVPTKRPGVTFKGDWDVIGQRLTESGGCVINNVKVPWSEAAGFVDKKLTTRDVYHDFISPRVQLQFAAVYIGAATGALETAAEYTRTRTRTWSYEGYGRLQAKIWATEALVDRTAERVSEAIHAPRETLTKDTRGKLAVQVAASKSQAMETALEVSSKIFEFVGASGSLSKYGFDRFWRNTRVHSLHDPISYKFREVGP
ncbi:acyl-CoA dehydrogenase/oxidase [Aspergillus stella-maris]|uniref:acyl-CoA dehydrogenase/oxidase n=1 Tax=Aspergillus stella-maris TaxID=1810926 RepID=UPI003CCD3CB8